MPVTASGAQRTIYARCIDGQADAANQRINNTLSIQAPKPGLDDQRDGEDEDGQAS